MNVRHNVPNKLFRRTLCPARGSIQRRLDYKASALPIELSSLAAVKARHGVNGVRDSNMLSNHKTWNNK